MAVVVLSWNGREDTLACLESLADVRWEQMTAVVVDNGSTDGTAEAIREGFPDTVVLERGATSASRPGTTSACAMPLR